MSGVRIPSLTLPATGINCPLLPSTPLSDKGLWLAEGSPVSAPSPARIAGNLDGPTGCAVGWGPAGGAGPRPARSAPGAGGAFAPGRGGARGGGAARPPRARGRGGGGGWEEKGASPLLNPPVEV